ncbi:MAG TPA: tetratricopeptide repeat protein [Opitutaceae bacterium]|nr:tetratricopeptide repeat protein [Opitutaceae bacterium]
MGTPRKQSWWKRLVFGCVFAGFLVALLLGGTEAVLRLANYGHAPGFWRKEKDAEGRVWIRENWWVTAPYFAPELMRRPHAFRLPEKKDPAAYRIFVLGSSAAMGDPEPSFSMARVLETLLRTAYPKVRFEVINAAVTAINSNVVRGIAADCAELQPDLFIVYEGNNEVIGPFGPATVFTPVLRRPGAIRAAIFLRGLRVGQLVSRLARGANPEQQSLNEWGGMQMFLKHEIAADDPRLETTEALFRDNLRAIVESGEKVGATVLLANVLTNQKDLAPFRSRHSANVSPEQAAACDRAIGDGHQKIAARDFAAAETDFRAATKADDGFAEAHFQLGRILLREGKSGEAHVEFQRAIDLDTLRFRTDSRLNRAIADTAQETKATFVDLVAAAEKDSPGGILGDELLYEHVHLTFRGTYDVAVQLFGQVSEDLKKRGRVSEAAVPLRIDEARERLAFTTYEQAMIVKQMLSRFQHAPFTEQSNIRERITTYSQRDARAAQLLSMPESAPALFAIYDAAIAANPSDWVLRRNYGMALVSLGRPDRAKPQLLAALAVIPDDPDTLYGLILAHRALGETAEAARRTEQLRKLEPRYPGLAELR